MERFVYKVYFPVDVKVRSGMMRVGMLASDCLAYSKPRILEETAFAILGARACIGSAQKPVVYEDERLVDFVLQGLNENDVGFVLAVLDLAGEVFAKATVCAECAVFAVKITVAKSCLVEHAIYEGIVAWSYFVMS